MSHRTRDAAVTVARVPVLWCVMMRSSPDRSRLTPSRSIRCGCMVRILALLFCWRPIDSINRKSISLSYKSCTNSVDRSTFTPMPPNSGAGSESRPSGTPPPEAGVRRASQEKKSLVGSGGLAVESNPCAYIVRIGLKRLRLGAFINLNSKKGAGRKSLLGRSYNTASSLKRLTPVAPRNFRPPLAEVGGFFIPQRR